MDEEHNRHQFTVVVHTVLANPSGVFLLRRREHMAFGGMYCLPGGYLEAGEGLLDAAAREVREEAGVEILRGRFAGLMSYRSAAVTKPGDQGLNAIFVADEYRGIPRILEPDKFSSADFFDSDSMPQSCVPWLADALDMAYGERGGDLIEHIWD